MRVSVAFEYPAVVTPKKSRAKKTVKFQDTIEVDIPDIEACDTPNALRVRFTPPDWTAKDERVFEVLFGDINLDGHGGRLWRDCWRFSRDRFFEIDSDRLTNIVDPGAQFASCDGKQEPAGGFLHWLDRKTNGYRNSLERKQPCVIRLGGLASIPGAPHRETFTDGVIVTDERDVVASRISQLVAGNFMVAGDRLLEATLPPAFQARRTNVGAYVCLDRQISTPEVSTGAMVWFRIDEKRELDAFTAQLAGARGQVSSRIPDGIEVECANPQLLEFDRTGMAINSLIKAVKALPNSQFHMLPNPVLEAWMAMRHACDAWSPEEGDPHEVIAAIDAFGAVFEAASGANKAAFQSVVAAFRAQRPMLDLSPRLRPVEDESLDELTI